MDKEATMKVNFIYMTAGSRQEAEKIGKELVVSRLAACVNILNNMNSIYMWQGEVQEDSEVVMIAKTTEDRVPQLVEKVKSLHSYECPCIVSIPVTGGNQAFLDWIAEEVKT
jgi:periplasmic divalent cation tolerance protein